MDIIRYGNDINVTWSVFGRNGAKYSLTGKIYHLWLVSGPRKKEISSYSLQARNQIVFVIDDTEINRLGTYKLVLQLKEPDNDTQDATYELTHVFQVVSETYPMRANTVINGQTDILVSSILKNVYISDLEGASAYEIAVNNGFVGTEAEWVGGFIGSVTCAWPILTFKRADNSEFLVNLTHTHPDLVAAIEALQALVGNLSIVSNGSYYTINIGGQSIPFYSKDQVDALLRSSGGGSGSGSGSGSGGSGSEGSEPITTDPDAAYLNFSQGEVSLNADGTVVRGVYVKGNVPWSITAESMPDAEEDAQNPNANTAMNTSLGDEVVLDKLILPVTGVYKINTFKNDRGL